MPANSRKKLVWIVLIGVAVFVGIAHTAYRNLAQQREEQREEVKGPLAQGMTLPARLELEGLGASKSDFSQYKGKVLLINFWAGWCGPCLHEMPALYELHKRLEGKGFAVLGVNMDDDPQDGLRALKRVAGEVPFPIYRGMNSSLAQSFDISGLPFTVVVDRDRKIRYARAGELNWRSTDAVGMIEGLL